MNRIRPPGTHPGHRGGVNRRQALCCTGALAAGLFSGLFTGTATAQAVAEGSEAAGGDIGEATLRNPCREGLATLMARDGAVRELVQRSVEGLDATRLIDSHAHLLGTGDSGSGCTIHPSMHQWWRPLEVMRRRAILNAACVSADAESIDRRYVQRLLELAGAFPTGARWWLFAFAKAHDDEGRERDDWSTFHVPDAYAAQVARAHAQRFDWVSSIHPYAPDALVRLAWAQRHGAVAVKWLPSAMNIDPASPRCRPFYDALARQGTPLIVHCGEEKAAPGAKRDDLVNPLLMRHPLAAGVRVIVAHAASLGHADDTDRPSRPAVPAYTLFQRVMQEHREQRHAGGGPLLMADISAVFQRNRKPEVWRHLVGHEAWHGHLIHGSDYPLPGLMPLFAPRQLVAAGLLDEKHLAPLHRLREYNPLLFDLALKRHLRLGSATLPAAVFEARALQPAGPATPARTHP